jgi:uncharacterized membrane protein
MRRNGLRPDNILTWLSLLGITCYVITWFGYTAFYGSFSVSPEAVGILYPALLIPAAVFFSLIVLLGLPVFLYLSLCECHWERQASIGGRDSSAT